MIVTTQNGREVSANDTIVVAENFPGMSMSQWFVAVYYSVAAYDSPYDPIIFMPKSGYVAGPKHDEKHRQSKELAEAIAETIRAKVAS